MFLFFSSHNLWLSISGSSHVSHHLLVIHGLEDVVLPGAVVVAGAGLDEHHVLLHDLSIRAFELHRQGGGPVGGAATTVQADATELGPVGLGGGAAWDLKLHGFWESGSTDALFPLLQRENRRRTISAVVLYSFMVSWRKCENSAVWQKLTLMLCSSWDSQGRTMHSLVCFSRRHSRLSLVTLVEIPRPQVLEQALHSVVWTKQLSLIMEGSGP